MFFKDGVRRYCIALFSVFVATQTRISLDPWVGDHVPFGTYLIAVVLTAWLAGTGPAIFSLCCGIFAAAHYIIPPSNTVLISDTHALLSLAIYGLVGVITIWLFEVTTRQHNLTRGQLRQIRKLSCALQTSDEQKDEFLALLAHELRNPLAPIRTGLGLLQRTDVTEAERSRVMQTICRQLEQLFRIVDDLLDVSRFTHGKIMLECQPMDLRDVVDTAVEQAQSDLDERQHCINVLVPSRPVPVYGDRIRIVQIVTNLLTNASKYTPRQGRIEVVVDRVENNAVLTVTDNGIGITREMQQHIFELFSRADAAIRSDRGGLGLGLPIAKQFATMHGGTLRVESEGADRGSRFELNLPLIAENQLPAQSESPPPSTTRALGTPESFSPQTRILVVDDNTDAADTLAALLRLDGFAVECVHDGYKALHRVHEFKPEVVLLDIGLPGMDGYEVARRLRTEFVAQPLLIIAVTGWGGDEDVRKSHVAGIDHHLVKPIDPERLGELMRDVTVVSQ